ASASAALTAFCSRWSGGPPALHSSPTRRSSDLGSGSLTGENTASTWTINAVASNSTYSDGSHSLTYSGFSTLDGGTGGNTFNVQAETTTHPNNSNTRSYNPACCLHATLTRPSRS